MPSASQLPHAAIVAVVAVLAVAGVAAVAMLHYDKASDAVTVLGPVTAVISSLVAAYFGVRSGSLALQKANEAETIRRQPETPNPSRESEQAVP
jgi:hypothetical protein